MSWFAVGGTALSVVSSVYSQKQARKGEERKVMRENSARATANLENAVRAGYLAGLVNLQEGQYKKDAARQGFLASASASEALGQVNANAAAAGSIGASVDAVAQDIDMRLGEMQARQLEDLSMQELNFDTQRRDIQMGADGNTVQMVTADLPGDGRIYENAALAGAGYFMSTYGSARMRLGSSGESSAPQTSSVPILGGTGLASRIRQD